MKKAALLSMLIILGLSTSSFAQTKEAPGQDNIKNAKTINASIADSGRISQNLQIKPCKFNHVSQDESRIIVIDGQVSEHGFNEITAKDIQSISVVKGEKAAYLYGNKNASEVIIITTKKDAK